MYSYPRKPTAPPRKSRQTGNRHRFVLRHLLLDRLQRVAVVRLINPNHFARMRTDKRIPPDVLAAFDRFEQERAATLGHLLIGRDRRLGIGNDLPIHGDQVAVLRQFQKLRFRRREHTPYFFP